MPTLHELIKANKTEDVLAYLRNESFDPTEIDKKSEPDGVFPLYLAVDLENDIIVNALLNHGANPNQQIKKGETALIRAVSKKGSEKIVGLLLSHKADPNLSASNGATPLYIAVQEENSLHIIRQLLESGANPNLARNFDHTTPLFIAVGNKSDDIVYLLLKNNADPDLATRGGRTALRLAVQQDYKQIAMLLVEKKADLYRNPYKRNLEHMQKSASFVIINRLAHYIVMDKYSEFIKLFDIIANIKLKNMVVNVLFQEFMTYSEIKKYILKLAELIEKPISQIELDGYHLFPNDKEEVHDYINYTTLIESGWNRLKDNYVKLGNELNDSKALEGAMRELYVFIRKPEQWMPMLTLIEKQFSDMLKEIDISYELPAIDIDQYNITGTRVLPHITTIQEENYNAMAILSHKLNQTMRRLLLAILQRHGLNLDSNKDELFKQYELKNATDCAPILLLSQYVKHDDLEPLMKNFSMLFREAKKGVGISLHDSLIHMLQFALFCLAKEQGVVKIDETISMPMLLTTLLNHQGNLWNRILDTYNRVKYPSETPFKKIVWHHSIYEMTENEVLVNTRLNHCMFFPYSGADFLRTQTTFKHLRRLQLLNIILPAIKFSRKAKEETGFDINPNTVLRFFSLMGEYLMHDEFAFTTEPSKSLIATKWSGIFFKRKEVTSKNDDKPERENEMLKHPKQ